MAKRVVRDEKPRTYLTCSVQAAQARVGTRIAIGQALLKISIGSMEEFKEADKQSDAWSDYNGQLLISICTTDELARKYYGMIMGGGLGLAPLPEKIRYLHSEIEDKLARLESIYEQLDLYEVDPGEARAEGIRDQDRSSPGVVINNTGTMHNPVIQIGGSGSHQSASFVNANAEVNTLLRDLQEQVAELGAKIDPEMRRRITLSTSVLDSELRSTAPRKEWWELCLEDIKKVAEDAGKVGKPVLDIALRLAPLLIEIWKASSS